MSDLSFDLTGKRVWVAGHRGMVGSAVCRRLADEPCEILTVDRGTCDLTRQDQVEQWMGDERPDAIVLAAAKVGGIVANDAYPAEFLNDNLLIQSNIIHTAHTLDVEKLLFLGSSCIYPKFADQPISEDALLTGPLEPTNQWYAIAKIAGIKLCQAYRRQYGRRYTSAMPTNLYGPGDNFDLRASHVVPALIRKVDAAKRSGAKDFEVWGSGTPLREFLYVDDLADALVFLLKAYDADGHINVGYGSDVTIRELAETICRVVGFAGGPRFNSDYPDGTPRKLMDSDRLLSLGWRPQTSLEQGLTKTYNWFLANGDNLRVEVAS
ncbi:MAG: GDP-L-fucose synthase [Pseudomonadota bacterium]